jgi:hypothetical protein
MERKNGEKGEQEKIGDGEQSSTVYWILVSYVILVLYIVR